jgi:hypothetical protein
VERSRYTRSFGKVGLAGGWIYYGTKYADETQEVFGSIAIDMIGKPTLTIYRGFDRYPGTYFNLSLADWRDHPQSWRIRRLYLG